MPSNEKKSSLLYIGHSFHARTHSTDFLLDILRTEYEIKKFSFDPFTDDPNAHFRPLYGSRYHVVLLFQVMPDLNLLQRQVHAEKFVFVPMFDSIPPVDSPLWKPYRHTLIISFSSTLHRVLKSMGYQSRFIRYFPKPPESFAYGNPRKVFFWKRINPVNLDTLSVVLRDQRLESIHLHNAPDPGHQREHPTLPLPCPVVNSTWFPRRDDLNKAVESAALYMAPRLYEGIGMSFLEAMSMGRCVIAPDHPTMNEYIVHGKTGFLYDPDNPSPLPPFDPIPIQKAAAAYMKEGFSQWASEKSQILKWISEWKPRPWHQAKGRQVPIMSIRNTSTTSVFWLFGLFPVLRVSATKDMCVSAKDGMVVYWLLGILPLIVKRKRSSDVSFWLFGIVRLWKSEVEHE